MQESYFKVSWAALSLELCIYIFHFGRVAPHCLSCLLIPFEEQHKGHGNENEGGVEFSLCWAGSFS